MMKDNTTVSFCVYNIIFFFIQKNLNFSQSFVISFISDGKYYALYKRYIFSSLSEIGATRYTE